MAEFKKSHSAFNDVLSSTIQRGQNLLSRNYINTDYDESNRKDLGATQSHQSREKYQTHTDRRYQDTGKSPLKDYISSKIDSHIERLQKPAARSTRVQDSSAAHEASHKSRHEELKFESQVQNEGHHESSGPHRHVKLNDSNYRDYTKKSEGVHHDELHETRQSQRQHEKHHHDQDHVRENVPFHVDKDRSHHHTVVHLDGEAGRTQASGSREHGHREHSQREHSHKKYRPELSKLSVHHHDSPANKSRVFDSTHHDVHHGGTYNSTFKSTYGSNLEDLDHPHEDHWAKTSRSIDKLHQRHAEIEHSRLTRGGPSAEQERERALFDRHAAGAHHYAEKIRNAEPVSYSSPHKNMNETLRLRALEDMSHAHVEAHETAVSPNNSNLVNRYHAMKQTPVKIQKQTLRYAATRINPPRCLLDVLDALFSLVYGIYAKVEHDYFATKDRKYFEYKVYFQNLEELFDVLKHLKLYMETQGIPERNILAADKALCRYNKTVKRIEAKTYLETTDEIAQFVLYNLEYYNILRKLNLEPLAKKDAERGMATTSPQFLKNSTKKEWHESIYEAPADHKAFTEEELVDLLKSTIKRKTWAILKSLEKPPESILFGIKGLHALFGSLITEPLISKKREWEFFQKLLRKTIPDLVEELPELIRERRIPEVNIRAAEGYVAEFKDLIVSRKEVNDSFVMQYATKIINFIHYAAKLYNLYSGHN